MVRATEIMQDVAFVVLGGRNNEVICISACLQFLFCTFFASSSLNILTRNLKEHVIIVLVYGG